MINNVQFMNGKLYPMKYTALITQPELDSHSSLKPDFTFRARNLL